jgi:hypothetical protein
MYSAADPTYMVMLIRRLGNDYVVWDKAASIPLKKRGVKRSTPAWWSGTGSWGRFARRSKRNARSTALLDRAERFFGNRLRGGGKLIYIRKRLARCETLRTH